MFSYGRGRAQQTLIAGTGSFIGFVPLLFLIYVVSLPIALLTPLYIIPLLLYAVLAVLFTTSACVSSGSISSVVLLFLFPLMHITNGCGLLFGFFSGKSGVSVTRQKQGISIRKIKEFEQNIW